MNILKLSDRKKKILSAVVSENIKNAEAVSSKNLQSKYFNDISSATIRNELVALEEMGYLQQQHTSSGRVPTELGFKKYIEDLMVVNKLSKKELSKINSMFTGKLSEMEELAQKAATVISDATNYASVVYLGILDEAIIEKVKIVQITEDQALVVVVTDRGIIKDITMSTEKQITEEDFEYASILLSEALNGKMLKETELAADLIKNQAKKYKYIFSMLLAVITKQSKNKHPKIDGASNLLDLPEYQSIEKAKKAIAIFENKDTLVPILKAGNDLEISIKIGGDTELEDDCSIVCATYKLNGKNIGKAGVIGPMRMDYVKAISVLKGVGETINNLMVDKDKSKGEKN